jgi:hypothetical protein
MDWTATFSALIGAAAALIGVLVTQRNARRNAHADRVWASRVACYQTLLEYSAAVRHHAFYRLLADMSKEPVPEDPEVINSQDATLFASEPVRKCFERVQGVHVQLHGQHLLMTKAESEHEREKARVAALGLAQALSQLGVELEDVIRRDVEPEQTGGGMGVLLRRMQSAINRLWPRSRASRVIEPDGR